MAGLEDLTGYLPSKESLSSLGITGYHILTYILLAVLVIALCGWITYILINRFRFKNHIIIFEKVAGKWEITGKDLAKEIKYGSAGDTVFVLRKRKKYLPRPELQTGRRVYWFAIRQDGEWINVGMEDIDVMMKQAKVRFLHPEMRYARTAMQRNLKDRLEKHSVMEKYGHIIIPIIGFIIIAVFLWLFMDKYLTASTQLNEALKTMKEVLELDQKVLSSLDALKVR